MLQARLHVHVGRRCDDIAQCARGAHAEFAGDREISVFAVRLRGVDHDHGGFDHLRLRPPQLVPGVLIAGIEQQRRRDEHCKPGKPAKLIVLLYNKEKNWENDKAGWKKRVRAVKSKNAWVEFKYVTPGSTYAVWVINAIECAGGFTMRWLPIPSPFDGVTASWKPEIKNKNRRPKWKHVNFEVKAGETKTFNTKMVYNLKWKG